MPYRNDQEALRGRVHSLGGQLREAREHLEQLRTPSPRSTKAHRSKGRKWPIMRRNDRPPKLPKALRAKAKISLWTRHLVCTLIGGATGVVPWLLGLGVFRTFHQLIGFTILSAFLGWTTALFFES